MKKLPFALSSVAALCLAMPLTAAVAGDTVWVDSKGEAVMSGRGECVQALLGVAHESCMPKKKEAPAPVVYGDADNDGVTDDKDQCPGTPVGAKVDAKGCTMDSDGDGVVDGLDQCPNTVAGAKVNDKGCAVKITISNLTFELNSAELSADSKTTLNGAANSLKGNKAIKGITVTGHTDSSGAASYNQMLSEKRAKAVGDYLASQGVSAPITTAGKGEEAPIADNGTAMGRAKNRRVELDITQ